MKTFKEYHREERVARAVMTVLTVIGAYLYYFFMDSTLMAVIFGFVVLMMNAVVGYARSIFAMGRDWVKIRHRMQWETSMLNSIKLATAAKLYKIDDPNVLSAFHAVVQERQDEGVKFGYIELGEL